MIVSGMAMKKIPMTYTQQAQAPPEPAARYVFGQTIAAQPIIFPSIVRGTASP
jgi:hypothetical protein